MDVAILNRYIHEHCGLFRGGLMSDVWLCLLYSLIIWLVVTEYLKRHLAKRNLNLLCRAVNLSLACV